MNEIRISGTPLKIADMDRDLESPPSPYRNLSCYYCIQMMDPARPSRPFKVPRLLDIDPNGIIEIGKSRNLSSKMRHFRHAVMGTKRDDSEGWTYGYIYDKSEWMRKMFRSRKDLLNSIRFLYIETDVKFLLARECKAIDEYCSLFGEPPLLNGQVPGVERKSVGHRTDLTMRPALKWDSDDRPFRPGMIKLTDQLPSPFTGLSCIYSVHMMGRNDPSKPFPVPRIARTDPEGRLAIGKTINLARRLTGIRTGIYGTKKHGEWALFHHNYRISKLMRKVLGPWKDVLNYLYISYIPTRPSLLDKGEIRAFDDYISQFAEPPPLNCQIPGDTRYK